MQDFIRQVAAVQALITARLLEPPAQAVDPRGPLVLAVDLVEAGTTDEPTVHAAVAQRWPGHEPQTTAIDPLRTPPATHSRWKAIPDDLDLMVELSNRLSDAWEIRAEPSAMAPEEDLLELHGKLFAIEVVGGSAMDFQAEWDRYIDFRPWTAHEKTLDRCGLSLHSTPTRPELHKPTTGTAPLDRGVLQRLDRPLRQPGALASAFARIDVIELVDDEIRRATTSLGLRNDQALAALTLGLAAADLIGRTDPRELPQPTEHAPVRVQPFLRVEKLAHRYHGRHKSSYSPTSLQTKVEHLEGHGLIDRPQARVLHRKAGRYRRAIEDPIRSIGPRLHPVLHRADIACAHGDVNDSAADWWGRVNAALNSWIRDIYDDVKTVLTAEGNAAQPEPNLKSGPEPATILELVVKLLDGDDPEKMDPLALLDITADHYLELVSESLQSAYLITPQQAHAMLPTWQEVSAAISPELKPELSPTAMYTRSRALCRRLGIVDGLLGMSPQDAAEHYENAVTTHVAQARTAGALVSTRHYSAPRAFVTRLHHEHLHGTGQVADKKEEES